MPKIVPPARHGAAIFAALVSSAMFAAPIERALGAGSAPVTVTSPALTSSVDNFAC
jgi:hypothetical protein